MSLVLLDIVIPGQPVPKGSLTPRRTRDGRVFNVATNKPALDVWSNIVVDRARAAFAGKFAILTEVDVFLICGFVRPKNHYRTGRNAHLLRDDAPRRPRGKPDLDRLQRCIGDCLTDAHVIKDDALIVHWEAHKVWAPAPYAWVQITPASEPPRGPVDDLLDLPQPRPESDGQTLLEVPF